MKLYEGDDEIQAVYGQANWVGKMAVSSPLHAQICTEMVKSILTEGALTLKMKHFILFLIYLMKGNEPLTKVHAEAAIRCGATVKEWHEVLFTGVMSRGVMAYSEGARILDLGQVSLAGGCRDENVLRDDEEEILAYFRQAFGSVPSFVHLMGEKQPGLLQAYYKGRTELTRDTVLPRKYKELLLVGLNAAERYHFGIEAHGKGALAAGATHEQLLEAITTAVLGGGFPAWVEAAAVYLRITARDAPSAAAH